MDLSLRSESFAADDTSWLRSRHGTQATVSGTLDTSTFTAATHYPDGYFKSGIPLGRITATGKYGPYASNTSEVQTVTVTGSPTGGTFTLTFSGQTTTGIAYNASASAVQSALVALSNINPGDVTVTGSGPYSVTFGGQYLGTDVAQMTASGSGLTGGTSPGVTVATGTAGGGSGASDGRETLAGFLMFSVRAPEDATVDVGAAVFMHGAVVASRLPVPVDTAGKSDVNGRIWFV